MSDARHRQNSSSWWLHMPPVKPVLRVLRGNSDNILITYSPITNSYTHTREEFAGTTSKVMECFWEAASRATHRSEETNPSFVFRLSTTLTTQASHHLILDTYPPLFFTEISFSWLSPNTPFSRFIWTRFYSHCSEAAW
jgi:hypothetical protein